MSGIDIQSSAIVNYFESLGYRSDSSNGRVKFREFAGTAAELNSLYAGVGLRDISRYGIIELRGNDVLDFLHRITTNSLKNLQKESIAYTIFTNEKGRIIDSSALLNFGDYQLLITAPDNKLKVIAWINKYTISDDVKVSDSNGKYILFELLGPQSDSFSTLLCGDTACKLNENTFKVIHTEGMLFFIMRVKENKGPVKYWILSDQENGLKLVKYLIENKGPFEFNMIGEEAYNIFRVEQGIPAAPDELNDLINPNEAGQLDLVDFTKGCYIGQEVIARLDTYDKVQKHLYGIKFTRDIDLSGKHTLFESGGIEAGSITTAVYSHRHKSSIGLAYIKKAYAEAGKELYIKDASGDTVEAVVTDIPFKK